MMTIKNSSFLMAIKHSSFISKSTLSLDLLSKKALPGGSPCLNPFYAEVDDFCDLNIDEFVIPMRSSGKPEESAQVLLFAGKINE